MLSEAAKEARRAYRRKWAKQNRDKVKAQEDRYWEKRAKEERETRTQAKGKDNDL